MIIGERLKVVRRTGQQIGNSFARISKVFTRLYIHRVLGHCLLIKRKLVAEAPQRALYVLEHRAIITIVLVTDREQSAVVGIIGVICKKCFA